jgi:hypothetical protein
MASTEPLRRFNSDPDALAWARQQIQHEIERLRKWQQKAADEGRTEQAAQWKKMANLLEMRFIGGTGCVIAAFDHRRPRMESLMADTQPSLVTAPQASETVHLTAGRTGRMACCGRTPFELPRSDRMTESPEQATCKGRTVTAPQLSGGGQ